MINRSRIRKGLPAFIVSATVLVALIASGGGALGTALATISTYGYGTEVSGGGGLQHGPGSSPASPGEDVFVQGNDNGIWMNHYNTTTTSTWTGFVQLGGLTNASPSAVTTTIGKDVFIRGVDNQLWQNHWLGSSWSGWHPRGGILGSGPGTDYQNGATTVDVYVRGGDGVLYWERSVDNGQNFNGYSSLGGVLKGEPGATSWAAGRADVFIRGQDNALWHKFWTTGGGWSGWESLGGIVTASPSATSCSSGHLDILVRGSDGRFYQKGWTGTGWTGWAALSGGYSGSPSATCRPGGGSIIDVFGRGLDGALWVTATPAH